MALRSTDTRAEQRVRGVPLLHDAESIEIGLC